MMTVPYVPEVTDTLPIALRAFAEPDGPSRKPPASRGSKVPSFGSSSWAIIFDTETTTDASQHLRFGTYQVRQDGELREAGIFFDPDGITPEERERLSAYADRHGLQLITREEFVDQFFYSIGWEWRAAIVGFNLPFDISRIAIKHGSARTAMRGGFSFTLSRQKIYPHVQVKHLSQRAAFIQFANPMRSKNSRGMRNRGMEAPPRVGHFVDVKTLGGALLERSFSLSALSKFLNVEHPKLDFDDFDGPITDDMIAYAVRDVQTTWECYVELLARLERLGLPDLPPEKVYSAASIGKGYLRAVGIKPWRKCQPDFPRAMLANIMGSYFGGRSEIRIRRELRQVILCDFLSMYPTVCTLMGLWNFVIADGMQWQDATQDAKALLEQVDIATLQSPTSWRNLATLVRVLPDGDIFPVRAAYMGEGQSTIATNHLSSDTPLWFTMADCIAAKLLTGKAPQVVEAVTFCPGPVQDGLHTVDISGNADYRVDPTQGDFYRRVIELRQSVKTRRDGAIGNDRDALDTEQNALKIAANSTAYGVFVEVNVVKRGKRFATTVHSATDSPFGFATDKAEEPGPYFHPLLASLITGAARLMLAITERLVGDHGLEWSFCDTDSMAIAKPDTMEANIFRGHVAEIVEWFAALNPYEFGGSILKVEDVNASLETGEPHPLYCWAISAKRYALFNLGNDGVPILRKVSAHGLGHLLPPYDEDHAPMRLPVPHRSVLKDGIKRWHCDLWDQIIIAAQARHPDQVSLDYHSALHGPAISRYGATSPELLNWFREYNRTRPYRDQVKPFGFLLALSARRDWGKSQMMLASGKPLRARSKQPKPIAPFDRDFPRASKRAFDRDTGAPVTPGILSSYADVLKSYHLQPESKFLNGDHFDRGTTLRRHVRRIATRHIGKEANDWEQQAVLGIDPNAAPDYDFAPDGGAAIVQEITELAAYLGWPAVGKVFGLPVAKLKSEMKGAGRYRVVIIGTAAIALPKLWEIRNSKQAELAVQRNLKEKHGLRAAARILNIDPSNLRRRLNRDGP